MAQARSAVRIALLEGAPRAAGARDALRRLGGEARVERFAEAAACLDRCRDGEIDLVVVDAARDAERDALLAGLRDAGPPVVVVVESARGEGAALEAFRRGAADCVAAGPQLGEALPVVALEQIRRWRGLRERAEIQQLQSQVQQTEKMASIGQLAAGVAHEINNPMGFIHANLFQMAEYLGDLRRVWSAVEALRKAAAADASPDVRRAGELLTALAEEVDVPFVLSDFAKAIRESQEGSERIRHIVQDLRDFSHQETGERELADLNQCLDSTANIVWPMMKHLVALEKEYAALPPVPCFPMQLKQVFMNLLVNAYQAIEERCGGRSGASGRIRLETALRDGGVVVTVSDDGVGIPRENLRRIFEPFFTTKKVGAGTGLGLSTSYTIVRRHGGRLTAESEPGQGSRLRMFLPLEATR